MKSLKIKHETVQCAQDAGQQNTVKCVLQLCNCFAQCLTMLMQNKSTINYRQLPILYRKIWFLTLDNCQATEHSAEIMQCFHQPNSTTAPLTSCIHNSIMYVKVTIVSVSRSPTSGTSITTMEHHMFKHAAIVMEEHEIPSRI